MNLVWKILGITAALFLAASAVISYLGREAVKQEQVLAQRAKTNLATTRQRSIEADDALKENTTALAQAETDRDAAVAEVKETNSEEAEYTAEIAARKINLEQVKQRVADIKLKIRELGSIEKLLADIENIEKKVAGTENEIVNRDQRLKIAVEKVEAVTADVSEYTELERRQRKGLVAEDFKANVTSVFPNWGFVLLNKGNRDGVYANAQLEIERGGQTLGKLFVTRVEQDRSVANLVADTWPTDSLPQPGDLVVRAPLPEVEAIPQANSSDNLGFPDPGSGGFEEAPADTNNIFNFDDGPSPEGGATPKASDPFGDF